MAYEDVRDRHLKQSSKNFGFGATFPSIVEPKSAQVRSKIDPKTDTKLTCILTSIFNRFGSILGPKMGGQGVQRTTVFDQKSDQIPPGRPRTPQDPPRPLQDRFWTDFEPILDRFGTDFGPILDRFGLILDDSGPILAPKWS